MRCRAAFSFTNRRVSAGSGLIHISIKHIFAMFSIEIAIGPFWSISFANNRCYPIV